MSRSIKHFNTALAYLILCFGLTFNLSAQNRFNHLTTKDGLTNNSVNYIYQTENGFLWFGTLNGLSRYDGKEIRNYSYEPGNEFSLTSNRIYTFFEDDWNYIWVLTYEFQVLRFDPQTERFLNITSKLPPGIFKGKNRVEVASTSPSVIWIASEDGGIVRVKQQKDSEEFTFDYFTTGTNAPSDNETFIKKDSGGRIWIGTKNGLMVLENDHAPLSELTVSNKHIIDSQYYFTRCFELEDGNMLLGTVNEGIFEYRNGQLNKSNLLPQTDLTISDIEAGRNGDFLITTQGNGIYHVDRNLQVSHHLSKEIQDYYTIYSDHNGTFWLRTHQRGISMFNPLTKVLRHYDLNSKMRESQGDPDKPKFLEDSKGNVWFGIYGGGLFKFDRETQRFKHFDHQKANTHSLSSNFVLTLFEDRSENLWVGTFKNGLNKLDLSASHFHYKELVKNPRFESENEVRCIVEDDKQRTWLGTKYGNIYCLDKNNNILFTIPEDLKNKDEYTRGNVYTLLTYGNDLWVGTKGNGLYQIKDVIDFEKNTTQNFKINVFQHDNNDATSITHNDVFSLLEDQYGQIWVGTYHGGLSVIKNPSVDIRFENYSSTLEDTTSLSDNRVRKIYQDRNNNLWVGTVYGLNFLDSRHLTSDTKPFRSFYKDPTTVNSLANNDIFDIHQDMNGMIWVATYGGGLNSIKIDDGNVSFNHFFRKDGLPSNIIFSILEDRDLNLWLGTDNGIGKFSTKTFTSELVDNNEHFGHDIFSEGCKYKAKNRDFIFGTLNGFVRFNPDSINIQKQAYPIIFTGFELFDEVILPGANNSPLHTSIDQTKEIKLKYNQNFIGINFAVMDFDAPDKIQYSYILENYEDKWNTTLFSQNATYKALPPGKYIFKLKATNSRGIFMDQVRELAIVIKPPFWKTAGAYLFYFALLAGILYLVFKELKLRNEIKYETKLSEEKFKFFTNISHEFKTPLTLINNSIEDISKATVFTKDVRSSIQLIKRNAQSLNGLIEQLINFRRLQKGKIDLQVKKIDIISYLNDIYLTFLPYAEKKELKFNFDTDVESIEGLIDVRYTDIIINNLLSNAFKNTPSNKKIVLSVEVSKKSESIRIKIQDQGEGISQEYIDKIFERFVFVENYLYPSFKGSGIGLSLAKEMAQLHKGSIQLASEINVGSTFTVEIPISEKHYDKNEIAQVLDDGAIQQPKPFHAFVETSDEQPVAQYKKSGNATKPKLLIIDDNKELREYLQNKLEKENTVFVGVNGEEGLKLAKEVNPDLILSDLKMPKVDGIELTKQLKSNVETSHIPIILLTAKSALNSKIEGIDSGADDYITKPFDMEYLKRRIANVINQRKQLKEIFTKEPGFETEKLSVSDQDQEVLTKVISLIETNIKISNYTIDDMIAELGYSRSAFYKKMKSISGYSPKEFVRIVKMKKAAEMLRSPGVTISEVGYNVGFNDTDYFRKSFKNFFGETPSSYQKKYR